MTNSSANALRLLLLAALSSCAGELEHGAGMDGEEPRTLAQAQATPEPVASFGAEELVASEALGTKRGDSCGPNPWGWDWALCDFRRGLVCATSPVPEGTQDVTSHCMCVEGTTFKDGRCVNERGWPARAEWSTVTGVWDGQLRRTGALGANPGDACSPNGKDKWARCETGRGLTCVRPPEGTDGPATCACPEGTTFVEKLCVR